MQNYPNPFNPSTNIKFAVPKTSNVTLKVYDMLGQTVSALIDNQLYNTGEYTVNFDGQHFASGVYFYSLEAADFKDTKKMIIVK
jgi:hypothetical protein